MRKMRGVAVILGSESDLVQCGPGLRLLGEAVDSGEIHLVGDEIVISSIHRDHDETIEYLKYLHDYWTYNVDVLIAGAGWANALTGICDSYFRYSLRSEKICVVGVAFEDKTNPENTRAAFVSMARVPSTQVIYSDDRGGFVGPYGFTRACQYAIRGGLPELTIPEPRPRKSFSLDEAIATAEKSD